METKMRLIDANPLIEKYSGGDELKSMSESIHDSIFVEELRNAPTVDATLVVHSRWEEPFLNGIFVCRNCFKSGVAHLRNEKTSYCPDCGAKMDGGADHGKA